MSTMDFSDALIHLKAGERITRGMWPGKHLYLAPRSDNLGPTIYFTLPLGGEGIYIPSNSDILANDWELVKVMTDA